MTSSNTLLDISYKVGMSVRSLQRFCDKFISYMIDIKDYVIKLPQTEDKEYLHYNTDSGHNIFLGALYAIDGTLIKMKKSLSMGTGLLDRHGNQSVNVMLLFSKGCHIVNCYTNKPGSTHDSAVFRDSYIYNNLNNILGEEEFILGDGGYPLLPKLMVPYRNSEIDSEVDGKKATYNYCHSSARMIAERGIGLLKGRISSLQCALKTSDTVYAIYFITAAIVLHEFLLKLEGDILISNLDISLEDLSYAWEYTPQEKSIAKRERKRITDQIWNQTHSADVYIFVCIN